MRIEASLYYMLGRHLKRNDLRKTNSKVTETRPVVGTQHPYLQLSQTLLYTVYNIVILIFIFFKFNQAATRIRSKQLKNKYSFVINYQLYGVPRVD